VKPPSIRPSAITCSRCGGTAASPETDRHAAHRDGCNAIEDYEGAMARVREMAGAASWQVAVMAAQQGVRAVAEAAYVPGGPSVDEIEAHYRALQAQTRGESTVSRR
jgi:hypothetical protein